MKTSYAIVCCTTGAAALIEITKEETVIRHGAKKIKGDVDRLKTSKSGQVFFSFETGVAYSMFRVVKMTTISPLKHRGTQADHDRFISKL